MAKHLNDIFGYERGKLLNQALLHRDEEQLQSVSRLIAEDLAEFVAETKWNNIRLEVDPSSAVVKTQQNGLGIVVLTIEVKPLDKISNAMELIDAISDVEDMIDAAVHEIEDFDSIFISLTSSMATTKNAE